MSVLQERVLFEGEEQSVNDLRLRFTGHMVASLSSITQGAGRMPTSPNLLKAARLLEFGWPALLGQCAAWLGFFDALADAGLVPAKRAEVLVALRTGKLQPAYKPTLANVAALAETLSVDQVSSVMAQLDSGGDPLGAVTCRAVHPSLDVPMTVTEQDLLKLPPRYTLALVTRLPTPDQERVLLRLLHPYNAFQAETKLVHATFLDDLLRTPALKAKVQELKDLIDDRAKVSAALSGPTLGPDQVTKKVAPSLSMWMDCLQERVNAPNAALLAVAACRRRFELHDAKELGSLQLWNAASEERRVQIAETAAAAVGFKFDALVEFAAATIAVLRYKRRAFCLIPGGRFTRGLSLAEEQTLQGAEELGELDKSHHQLMQSFDSMRPFADVSVEPFLLAQGPGPSVHPSSVAKWLDEGPCRLPSEAEWEFAARGGRAGELHPLGNDIPLVAHLQELRKETRKAVNPFGLWGLGMRPELCADTWHSTYEGAPLDGSPRAGLGPLTSRGGADELYPWQGAGEWHLLLTAMRCSAQDWEFEVALRATVGLSVS